MEPDWQSVTLADVATLRNGAGVKQDFFRNEGIPLARVSDFTTDSIELSNPKFVDLDHAKQWEDHHIEQGDVIVATVGSWPPNWSSVVGKVVRAPKQAAGAIQNQNTCCVKPLPKVLDNRYLFYRLKCQDFVWHAANAAGGSANQARLPVKKLGDFEFYLPPSREQKAIAHILGTLDDKIELNRQINTTLESMAQALFKSWFVDFDPVIDNALAAGNRNAGPPIPEPLQAKAAKRQALGAERKPLPNDIQQQFPDRFVFAEEMGWVPEGWEVRTVSDALTVNPRVSLKKGQVAKFVDMKALPTTGYSVDDVSEKVFSGGAKFERGDVLLARITPCLENGKTGVVDFLASGEVGFGSTEFIVLRSKGEVSMPFVAALAREANFRQHCITNMVGSSGRQRVQNDCFSSYYLALPTIDSALSLYNQYARPWFEKMTELSQEVRTLAKLRDTLLPKLLSGEIRIPEAELQVAEAT